MFGNLFICSFEPEVNLDKEMGYLLGGSYHGHDSIFLLNRYGVRWQVEAKQTYANAMSVVGPVWSDFVCKNITQDVKCLHFIEEGEEIFYVTMYNKYRLEMHGYRQKRLIFWRCLLNVTDRSHRAQTLPLVFVPKVYSTSQSDTVDLFIKDRECEVFIGLANNLTDDESRAFYIKLTSDVLILGRIRISKGFIDRHELRGYASAVLSHRDKKFEFKLCKKSKSVEMLTTLRDMVISGFWRGQWVRFYLSKDTSLEDGVVRFEVC
ncbi:hypothetical protein Tco_1075459 [Tanacetum coccineum]